MKTINIIFPLSYLDHLKWKGLQVFFSWAMHGEAEHPSSTHARKIFICFYNMEISIETKTSFSC